MNQDEIISQLRDIHAGPPISWWPPAPGIYLVVGVLVVLVGAVLFFVRASKLRQLRKNLLLELNVIEKEFLAHNDRAQVQSSITALFRRLAFFVSKNLPRNCEIDLVGEHLATISRDKKNLIVIMGQLTKDRFHKDPDIDAIALINLSREQIKRCRI